MIPQLGKSRLEETQSIPEALKNMISQFQDLYLYTGWVKKKRDTFLKFCNYFIWNPNKMALHTQ